MKKNVLVICMAMVVALCGCGGESGISQENGKTGSVMEMIGDAVKNMEDEFAEKAANIFYELPLMHSKKATIEETVLVDEKGIKITAKSLDYAKGQTTIKVEIVNGTNEKLDFLCGASGNSECNAINRYHVGGGYFNVDVNAGTSAEESVKFNDDDMIACGITDIAEIGLCFVAKNDEYDTVLDTGLVTIATSAYDESLMADASLKTAVNNHIFEALGLVVEYTDDQYQYQNGTIEMSYPIILSKKDDVQNKAFLIEVKNNGNRPVRMELRDIKADDVMAYNGSWTSQIVSAGCRGFLRIGIENLLDNEMRAIFATNDIGKLGFELAIYNENSWTAAVKESVSFTVNDKTIANLSDAKTIYEKDGLKMECLKATESEYRYYLPIMVTNGSNVEIRIDDEMDSLFVNGEAADGFIYSTTVVAGGMRVLNMELLKDDAEEIGINSLVDIKNVKVTFEIRFDKKTTTETLEYDL